MNRFALGFGLVAAALAVGTAHAQACGTQADFLVRADRLLAPVRPNDCANLFQAPPDFTWPSQGANNIYTVSLTFPDGHTETRTTSTNWLAWDQAVPAGRYAWKVSVAGSSNQSGELRTFTLN